MQSGRSLLTFWKNILPPSSRSRSHAKTAQVNKIKTEITVWVLNAPRKDQWLTVMKLQIL
jgi:hypothetical protein